MRHFVLQTPIVIIALVLIAAFGQAYGADPSMQQWVNRLNDDSYHLREKAKRVLLENKDNPTAINALQSARQHSSLEVRVASDRILQELALIEFDRQLQRLSEYDSPANSIQLPGWKLYSSIAGTDPIARNLFARIAREHCDLLYWMNDAIQRDRTVERTHAQKARLVQVSTVFDPYRMPARDASLWALLFCSDTKSVDHGLPNLTLRVSLALSQSGLGPKSLSPDDQRVMVRLISHWIEKHPGVGTRRDRLQIAMRYGCKRVARQACDQVLSDPLAAPSDQSMAMLCVAVLGKSDLEQILQKRLTDDRTAHVWNLIASRKTKVRTQVSDVALALLLRHHGIDPRKVGFTELQADPVLVYRDHSLGFPNDSSRSQAYQAAKIALDADS